MAVRSFLKFSFLFQGLGLLTMFVSNKNITFTYLMHIPYVIYPPTLKNCGNLTSESTATNRKYVCNRKESGPFMGISRPLRGLSNQFLFLHSILLLSYGFEGTIIFPRHASKRIHLRSNETTHEWQETATDTLFDVVATVRKLRLIGMNICIASEALNCKSETTVVNNFDFAFISRRCWGKIGCFGRHSTNLINRRFNNKTCLLLPNVWGGAPIPHSVSEHTDFLQLSAAISQSISFAPNLISYGRTLYKELLVAAAMSDFATLIVVHLRVEHDWRNYMRAAYNLTKDYTVKDLLEPYDTFLKHHHLTGLVYIAVGSLSGDEKSFVYDWANEMFAKRWTDKSQLSIYSQLKHFTMDELAVVDQYVISQADEFVGTGVSSMSYIASELRSFNGLKSLLVLPPGEIFYPLAETREFVERKLPVMKLTN